MEGKISCNVIKDLLPLYADGACSEETRALVEAHLEDCEECFEALRKMRAPIELQDHKKDFAAKRAFKKVKRIWIVSVILILVVCIPLAYLGVNQFANNGGVSFTNIPAILAANKVASAFESNDAEEIKEKVTPMLTEKFEAIKEGIEGGMNGAVTARYGENTEDTEIVLYDLTDYGTNAIKIDGEYYVATDSVLENEYTDYLEDNDGAKFWLNILNNGKSAIPDTAVTLVKEKYGAQINNGRLALLSCRNYEGKAYYVKAFEGMEDGGEAGFGFMRAEVIPLEYYIELIDSDTNINMFYRKFDTEIIEKGLDGYLEDAKKDISDRIDFFKIMGFSFHDLRFAGCVSVGDGGYRVSYDIYYDIKAKGIVNGGTLYVTYKNGEITDVHESLSREILDRHGNWVSVLGSYDVDLSLAR